MIDTALQTWQPYTIKPDGGLSLDFHAGQWRAWDVEERFILVLAGTQSGKTVFGPHWLYREIQRRGPGDYIVVTPTYPLLDKKALPEFKRLFIKMLDLGKYVGGSVKTFTFSEEGLAATFGIKSKDITDAHETKVFFGHAQDPDSLESATAKAAWLDEAGQKKFKLESWEAVRRRLSIYRGRVLITTTPYYLGWLKKQFWDARDTDPSVASIRFESIQNPAFTQEEFEDARAKLPAWKFDMFYRAIFTRPAGMIYDCFDEAVHTVEPFSIPDRWVIYLGLDFGGVNTAAVYIAHDKSNNKFYLFDEYHEGGRTAAQHAAAVSAGHKRLIAYGGAPSEDQWRSEFAAGGLAVMRPPISDVEVGIDRVYSAIKNGRLLIFKTAAGVIDELLSYSRVLNEAGEPTEKIEDKNIYHKLDGLRYIMSYLIGGDKPGSSNYA